MKTRRVTGSIDWNEERTWKASGKHWHCTEFQEAYHNDDPSRGHRVNASGDGQGLLVSAGATRIREGNVDFGNQSESLQAAFSVGQIQHGRLAGWMDAHALSHDMRSLKKNKKTWKLKLAETKHRFLFPTNQSINQSIRSINQLTLPFDPVDQKKSDVPCPRMEQKNSKRLPHPKEFGWFEVHGWRLDGHCPSRPVSASLPPRKPSPSGWCFPVPRHPALPIVSKNSWRMWSWKEWSPGSQLVNNNRGGGGDSLKKFTGSKNSGFKNQFLQK